jgi:transposase
MARPVGGQKWVKAARVAVGEAKSAHELRMAQAMLLPVAFGMNLNQVAEAIGQSVPTVTRLRQDFVRSQHGESLARARRGGRRNEHMTLEQEQTFLAPYLKQAQLGGMLIVPPVKLALEKHLGKPVALSSVYRLLHRHGWRKLAPDKRHPDSDPQAQAEWKKNSPKHSPLSSTRSKRKARSG